MRDKRRPNSRPNESIPHTAETCQTLRLDSMKQPKPSEDKLIVTTAGLNVRSAPHVHLLFAVFLAVVWPFPNAALAQAMPTATPKPSPSPMVGKVQGEIKLHSRLEIICDGLNEWAQTKANDPAKLTLYLEGTQMKGLVPKIDKINQNEIFFRLERVTDESKADNSKAWDALFSGPKWTIRNVRVTIGPETGIPFDSSQTAPLRAIDSYWFLGWVAFSLLLLVGMGWLARCSDLLRDAGDQPAGGRKPYSIARWQMAFWFFLIVVAYFFIFMITGATNTITASVLGLMGISAGTGLAAVVVDNSKRAQARTELEKLKTEQAKLQGQQSTMGTTFPAESKQRLNDLPDLIGKQQKLVDPSVSQGFFYDILSDADGISFHRLQIAVWTVVLGIIFCDSVYHVLSMPNFSETLLGLMGISGGTYIGFKFPEKLS
jgi:hypothetical protein